MIKWVPEVHAGHLIQAAAVIITIGTGSLGAYYSINSRISLIELQINTRADIERDWKLNVRDYMKDTAASLNRISSDITEMKVSIARKVDLPAH